MRPASHSLVTSGLKHLPYIRNIRIGETGIFIACFNFLMTETEKSLISSVPIKDFTEKGLYWKASNYMWAVKKFVACMETEGL